MSGFGLILNEAKTPIHHVKSFVCYIVEINSELAEKSNEIVEKSNELVEVSVVNEKKPRKRTSKKISKKAESIAKNTATIMAKYQKLSVAELAKEMSLSTNSIRKYFKKLNIEPYSRLKAKAVVFAERENFTHIQTH